MNYNVASHPGGLAMYVLNSFYKLETRITCNHQLQWIQLQVHVLTNLKSLPSNFRAFVNTTVLAGMLRPRANVSVANRAYQKTPTTTY